MGRGVLRRPTTALATLSLAPMRPATAPHLARLARSPASPPRRPAPAPRSDPRGADVGELLQRDRRAVGALDDDLMATSGAAFDDGVAASEAAAAAGGDAGPAEAPAPSPRAAAPAQAGPRTCRAALDAGEEALRAGDAAGAVSLFEAALDLPGLGAVRAAGSVIESSCPSDAEEAACLYNMACAYAALGQKDSALTCLEAALAVDGAAEPTAATARGDPDLAPLAGAAFEAVLAKAAAGGALGGLLGGGRRAGGDGGWLSKVLRPW